MDVRVPSATVVETTGDPSIAERPFAIELSVTIVTSWMSKYPSREVVRGAVADASHGLKSDGGGDYHVGFRLSCRTGC